MKKESIIILVLILLIISIAGVIAWKMLGGKKDKSKGPGPARGGGGTDTGNGGVTTDTGIGNVPFDPGPYAYRVYSAMKGLAMSTTDDRKRINAWKELLSLTTDQLRKVTEYFNQNLGDGETLKEWVDGESMSGSGTDFDVIKKNLMAKL